WPEQVMREVPAITVRDGRKNVFAVMRTFERDLRDPWKVFADGIGVVCVGSAEFVKINLLIKIEISVRPLAFSGKARVIDSCAVGVPSSAATGSRILDTCNCVGQRFTRGGFVKVKCAVFAPAFGKRYSYTFAVQ